MKIAIISDIHSNLEAFKAVLRDIDNLKIKKIFCNGDVIGYGYAPNKCLDIIKRREIKCTIGNHENAVILENTSGFNVYATEAIEWTISHITKENLKFIKNFPERIGITVNGFKILMVHGSPFDPVNEYVFPDYPLEKIVKAVNVDVVVMAHTHVPFIREIEGCLMINCGAVGQPRDHNPDACYVTLNVKERKAEIRRVKYDVKTAAENIVKSGLPEFLAQRLFLGV
jgi:putative phosphoesterase